jgi:hypothetical protein
MAHKQYFSVGITGADSERREMDGIWQPQDSRWHQITVAVDRAGTCRVYVDDEKQGEVDISAYSGQSLGSNTLVLGADLLGQYGLGNGCLDEFELYPGALSEETIQKMVYRKQLSLLASEITLRIAQAGPEYTQESRNRLAALVSQVMSESRESSDSDRALYEKMKRGYEDFLATPDGQAKLTMLLVSDIHIKAETDERAEALRTVVRDIEQRGEKIDGIINPGDFAGGATAANCDTAYQVINALMDNHKDWQMLPCLGNHETNYVTPEECYLVGAGAFWRNVQAHISNGADRKYGEGVLDSVQNYSYAMTFKGYHFLVLNSDYLEQTGDGKLDQTSNAADPIRHGVYFTEETFAWIEKWLDSYREDGKPVFVINHFPFIDTVPFSIFHGIRIKDFSIGPQDSRIRRLLGRYENLVFICGHLHSALGMNGPVTVESSTGGSFTEICLPALKNAVRAYLNMPATWIMQVYEKEIVLRARDFGKGEWLTAYDAVIPIRAGSESLSY